MKELLSNLIEALREELKQYGEMLALLDQQQQMVVHRQVAALPDHVNCVNAQAGVIAAARQERAGGNVDQQGTICWVFDDNAGQQHTLQQREA